MARNKKAEPITDNGFTIGGLQKTTSKIDRKEAESVPDEHGRLSDTRNVVFDAFKKALSDNGIDPGKCSMKDEDTMMLFFDGIKGTGMNMRVLVDKGNPNGMVYIGQVITTNADKTKATPFFFTEDKFVDYTKAVMEFTSSIMNVHLMFSSMEENKGRKKKRMYTICPCITMSADAMERHREQGLESMKMATAGHMFSLLAVLTGILTLFHRISQGVESNALGIASLFQSVFSKKPDINVK